MLVSLAERLCLLTRVYAPLRYITLPQFHRALDMCKLEISSAEVDLLAALFGGSDAWGRVNYKDFATTVDAGTTAALLGSVGWGGGSTAATD
jgi:hypothetical protein